MKFVLILPLIWAAAEGLTKEQIQEVIQKNVGQVLDCYDPKTKENPKLQGRVDISFDISKHGDVMRSVVSKTTLGNKEVEDCIERVSKQWVFPKHTSEKPVHVDYPFELRPPSK